MPWWEGEGTKHSKGLKAYNSGRQSFSFFPLRLKLEHRAIREANLDEGRMVGIGKANISNILPLMLQLHYLIIIVFPRQQTFSRLGRQAN